MKKSGCLIALVLLSTGCGALRITPRSCKTDAIWGANPDSTRGLTKIEALEEENMEIINKGKIFVLGNREIKLRDLLEESGIHCDDVRKIRVVIGTTAFFWRDITLKVLKK
ncbi:MAG: hypothetical protein K2Q18_17790 [Bdellovibrionales bacterium]|nr:hypothetical protein [Bdellovibrionales bacterium]